MQPSPAEIEFAQRRMRLQEALSPLWDYEIKQSGLSFQEFKSDIDCPEGHPQPDTLKGQILRFQTRIASPVGSVETVEVLIGHDSDWKPIVTVATTMADQPETIVYNEDEKVWIETVYGKIKAAFLRIANRH